MRVMVEFKDGSKEIVEVSAPNQRDAKKLAEKYATAEKYKGKAYLYKKLVKGSRVL
jgi:hypothetical protein